MAAASTIANGARVLLAGVRIANGAAGLVAPHLLAKRMEADSDAHYPFRLFGVRTVIIGAELLSKDPATRARAVQVALPIHAFDTASAAIGGLRGELPRRSAIMLTALSGTNTLLAYLARRG